MTLDERDEFLQFFFRDCVLLARAKGAEYAVDGDMNGNIRQVARETGQTPYQVWYTFMMKHAGAVMNYVRDPAAYERTATEPIKGRLKDLAVYMGILASMIEEENNLIQGVGGTIIDSTPTPKTIDMVVSEVKRSRMIYPSPTSSYHHGLGVLQEEVYELMLEVYKKPRDRDRDAMRREAVQVAATAIRFAEELT